MSNKRTVFNDILLVIQQQHLWRTLGWYDILARYRRSVLGPIWITISMAVTISAMGPLYGALFNFDPSEFVPHLGLGLIFWALISSSVNESAGAFSESAHYMKQTYIPALFFVLRVIYRQILILGHNLILYPIIFLILWKPINLNILWFIPGFILVVINLVFVGIILAIFCARYRDMTPVLNSVMSLLFFVTPIIWRIDQLPEERQILVSWNILTNFIDLLRAPLLGLTPSSADWAVSSYSALCLGIVAFLLYRQKRHRITYWL